MRGQRVPWQEWERRIKAWKASGESARVFAAREGWNPRTLLWWSGIGLAMKRTAAARRVDFVEVSSEPTTSPPRSTLEVVLRNGRRLRFRGPVDPARVQALVRALEA